MARRTHDAQGAAEPRRRGTGVDVLVPTYRRPTAVAVLLTSLAAQGCGPMRVVVSDQTEHASAFEAPAIRTAVGVLRARGHEVELHRHLPRRGLAEHRSFLLGLARAEHCLFLDDDLILEPDVVEQLLAALREEGCGFVGCGLIGPSFAHDVRPHEGRIQFWEGRVHPERVTRHTPEWERYRLHNAANLLHVERRLGLEGGPPRRYKVAWTGGCVMYRTDALRAVGGFSFWRDLPAEHCGEDVLAQLRVMARFGGAGIIPSGAYHQELPTTVAARHTDAPAVLLGQAATASSRPRSTTRSTPSVL